MTETPDPAPDGWSATPPYGAPSYDPSQYGTPQYGQQAYPGQSLPPEQGYPTAPYGQQPPTPGYGQAGYSVPGFAGIADPWAPYGRDPATGTPLSDKSKTSAGLLQLFLGGFGAGRFYLGHNGIAIAQVITLILGWATFFFVVGFFVLLALGIWTLVDAIMMFSGGVRDSRGLILRP
ncbi:NINE protein [Williamsia sp.]|uniref:TM2 domain-containing protein n=1 Tax=Williamsia sp. TaxID=1872085 RepID=UPI001A361A74|nr:NINE protein [Williamsia sp.]MBJ7288616.1 NINE protein [Williamsia sp.]